MKIQKLFLVLAVLILSGCGIIRFPQLNAPNPPDQVYNYSSTIEKQPQIATTIDGKAVVFESQKQTVDVNYTKKDKPLSAWQKFCNWLGNFGIVSILALIAALVIAPGGTMMWLWGRYSKFKKAFQQTAAAIDESKAIEKSPELKAALSGRQDNDVKALVDDFQQPGK